MSTGKANKKLKRKRSETSNSLVPTLGVDIELLNINWDRLIDKLEALPESQSEWVHIRHLLLHSKLPADRIVEECRKLISPSTTTSKH